MVHVEIIFGFHSELDFELPREIPQGNEAGYGDVWEEVVEEPGQGCRQPLIGPEVEGMKLILRIKRFAGYGRKQQQLVNN